MTKSNIQVNVDLKALMGNLKYAFTNKATMIAELMQNSRRAGATFVNFDYNKDTQTLVVTDNGCGVDDFQNLLSVATSGWDEETKAQEKPFGMGWLSVLYQAESVTIASKGQSCTFETKDALNFAAIEVVKTDDVSGLTIITLNGYTQARDNEILSSVKGFSKGYSIDVSFNGEVLKREHDVNGDLKNYFIQTEVGLITVPQFQKTAKMLAYDHSVKISPIVYLQGIEVYNKNGFYNENCPIVHLDSMKFTGRMPDRDVLIDEVKQIALIESTIKDLWLKHLEKAKSVYSSEDFMDMYFHLIVDLGLKHLFNDIDVLPFKAVGLVESEFSRSGNNLEFTQVEALVTKDDVVSGKVILCKLPDHYGEDAHVLQMAHLKDWVVVHNTTSFEKTHWIFDHLVDFDGVDGNFINVEINNVLHEAEACSDWIHNIGKLVICESYDLVACVNNTEFSRVNVIDSAVPNYSSEFDMLDIVVTKSYGKREYHNFENVFYMMSEYQSDENGDMGDRAYDDARDLSLLVDSLLSEDPSALILKLLQSTGLRSLKSLAGKKFTLTIDDECNPSLELIAA